MASLTYKRGRKLGAGASGTVYMATLQDGRRIAVKEITHADSDHILVREAEVLARLEHPNVVQFYGLQPNPRKPKKLDLLTEFVDGITLAELCNAELLHVNLSVYIIRQVLAALHHVHTTADLIHRDLSPRNILVSVDGPRRAPDLVAGRSSLRPACVICTTHFTTW